MARTNQTLYERPECPRRRNRLYDRLPLTCIRPDRQARAAGADAADAVLVAGTSLSVASRQGKTEHLERSEGRDLGLRVFVGKRAAIVSSTSLDPAGFAALAERAVAMAKVVPEDPFAGLAETWAPPEDTDLDMADPAEPAPEVLAARAAAAEDAALAVPGVTNSEGAEAGYGRHEIVLVTSAGFAGRRVGTSHSISATALAGTGTGMQRDYDYHGTVLFRRPRRPGEDRPQRRRAGDRPAQPDPAENRQDCRWSTIRASPAACSATSRARSTAPASRAAPAS